MLQTAATLLQGLHATYSCLGILDRERIRQVAYFFTTFRAGLHWSGAGAKFRGTCRASNWEILPRLLHRTWLASHRRMFLLVHHPRISPTCADGCCASCSACVEPGLLPPLGIRLLCTPHGVCACRAEGWLDTTEIAQEGLVVDMAGAFIRT